MSEVSTFRLYLLRAMYAFIVVGLAVMIWPGILSPPENLSHMSGVVRSMLGAVSLLAGLGVRYPLRMLPLLFFEMVWKFIWVLVFGFPLWLGGKLTPATQASLNDCTVGFVLVFIAMPWGYVFRNYVVGPGDRWARPAPREAVR